MAHWFRDSDFQRHLVTFICRDRNFLKKCGGMLQPKDFRPNRDDTDERWIIATLALEFWKRYKQPISGMLRPEVVDYVRKNHVDDTRKKALYKLVDKINSGEKLVAVEAMENRVVSYLRDKKMRDAIDTIIKKDEEGTLDNDQLAFICKEVLEWSGSPKRAISNFLGKHNLEHRIGRREQGKKKKRTPILMEDFDKRTRGLGRGELGMIIALYKMGKSTFLAFLADSYAKQGLNVLYFTLEDSVETVEDRMDAALAGIPIDKLDQLPNRLRKRFKKFSKRIQGRIRVVDCTDGGISVDGIEEEWEKQRDEGFDAEVIIVDYDDEIIPPRKRTGDSSRRMEFADIYKALRQLAAKRQVILWTAAQTKRMGEKTKIVTGDKLSEDISKIRKVALALGLGQGECHEDARYIYVAASKIGKSRFGFEIVGKPDQGLIYDREMTARLVWAAKKGLKNAA